MNVPNARKDMILKMLFAFIALITMNGLASAENAWKIGIRKQEDVSTVPMARLGMKLRRLATIAQKDGMRSPASVSSAMKTAIPRISGVRPKANASLAHLVPSTTMKTTGSACGAKKAMIRVQRGATNVQMVITGTEFFVLNALKDTTKMAAFIAKMDQFGIQKLKNVKNVLNIGILYTTNVNSAKTCMGLNLTGTQLLKSVCSVQSTTS